MTGAVDGSALEIALMVEISYRLKAQLPPQLSSLLLHVIVHAHAMTLPVLVGQVPNCVASDNELDP